MWWIATFIILLADLTEMLNNPYLFQNVFSENKQDMVWKLSGRSIQIYTNICNMTWFRASQFLQKCWQSGTLASMLSQKYLCLIYLA